MMQDQPVLYTDYERAEPHIEYFSVEEIKISIFGLNNWKAPVTNYILAGLIKYEGEDPYLEIYRLCQQIWVEG
jgi:hypothetical protein